MIKSFDRFRYLAIAEGISLLVLLLIAMPLKYYAGVSMAVPIVGMLHGLLFIGFFVFSLQISHQLNWSILFWLLVVLSSVIPTGTFLMDIKLKKIKATL